MANWAQLRGVEQMKERIRKAGKKFIDEVEVALREETEVEATEVKRRTPVLTGALRASVHVVGPVRENRTVYTQIVCGGPAAPYAWIVHEDLNAFHKVGQAKFLESVLMESRAFMARRVLKRMRLNSL